MTDDSSKEEFEGPRNMFACINVGDSFLKMAALPFYYLRAVIFNLFYHMAHIN